MEIPEIYQNVFVSCSDCGSTCYAKDMIRHLKMVHDYSTQEAENDLASWIAVFENEEGTTTLD